MAHVNDLVVHSLDASASKGTIEPILSLSNKIFNTASSSPTHHSSLDEWHKRLSQPTSVLLYARDSNPSSTEGRPVGFIFLHPKSDSSLPSQTLHIWLAGVAEQPQLFQPDHIHPSASAHPIMLANVWPYIKQLLTK